MSSPAERPAADRQRVQPDAGAEPTSASPTGTESAGPEPVGPEPRSTEPRSTESAGAEPADATHLADFAAGLPFDLDPFQREACQALEQGSGVLVCAPTGAGKTVVGEFAVHLALAQGRKCFYTTPIKALSNQKYSDLVARHGSAKVGLLTGDNSINGDAPVVVMTTEVLRNMIYTGSAALRDLGYVVMDEVHYLADRFRGPVWEEVIIHLPASVTLVSLSATVSNAEEFADWLVTVRGQTRVVVSEHRPVPLWQHMLVGRRLFDLFHDADAAKMHEVHPELLRRTREASRRAQAGFGRGRARPDSYASRPEVVARLDREGLLPAIIFVFSRAGCDAAVAQCRQAGLRLTDPKEKAEIQSIAESRTAHIPGEDLNVLGYFEWLDGLERGLAAHHAGMLPAFKEVVEELFVRGLVKAVFATETLALGINMPARCVVLEKLVKFNGEAHVDLTPGEYTQLTGRAGRRGIDVEGHGVVVWSPEVDPRHVAGLASTRTYPLRSSFRPSYNMAVNLVATVGTAAARELLSSSFAQYQADRAVVGLARQVQRNENTMQAYAREMECDRGDFAEYFDLRTQIGSRERALARESAALRRAAAVDSFARLKVGDVIRVPSGRRAGLAVVLDPGLVPHRRSEPVPELAAREQAHRGRPAPGTEPRPLVLTEDRWAGRIAAGDFTTAVDVLAHMRVPRKFNHRSPQERRDLAASLRAVARDSIADRAGRARPRDGGDDELAALRRQLRRHPCHACPDREEHASWAARRERLRRDTEALKEKVTGRTGSLIRTFDRVCAHLQERGYLDGGRVTEPGRILARIWTEADLLVAECLRREVWSGLGPAELAAVVSTVVYESRRDGEDRVTPVPKPVAAPIDATLRVWSQLEAAEGRHGLSLTRAPELGFVWPIYRWARGEPLARVLMSSAEAELPAGDFVRWARQVIDLLGQIAEASAPMRTGAHAAIAAINRGVVAYTSLE